MALATPTVYKGAINSVSSAVTGGTEPSGLIERQFVNAQDYMDPTETPFTSMIGDGETMYSKQIEWVQSFLVPHQTNLATAMTDTTGTNVNVTAGDTVKGFVSQLIAWIADGSNEFAWITAVPDLNNFTVVRGAGGSTASTHALNALIDFMPPAALENVDTPLTPVARGATDWNAPILMDFGIQESERAIATRDYETDAGDRYDEDLARKMKEAFRFFEKQAIVGRRSLETGGVAGNANARPSTMGGVLQFTSTVYNLAGAPITEYSLTQMLYDTYGRVDQSYMPARLFVGPFMRWALDTLWNANRMSNVKDDTINLTWRSVDTSFGELRFVLERYLPPGMLLLCNPKVFKKHKFGSTGGWREVPLPSSGPYKRGRFTGDYSMSFPQDAARSVIINASTNPSDYDNM